MESDGKAVVIMPSYTLLLTEHTPLPDLAVATVSPTHKKATVRKLTEFKIEYLITGEFLHRNKNENES